MKKIDLGQTISILANLGVIAGIVFLGYEISQNTDAIRSATIQAIADQSYDNSLTFVDNSELRAARRAARANSLTDDQQDQLDYMYSASLRIQQNRYLQARLGILDEETLLEIGTQEGYRDPYFLDYWSRNREGYSDGFREYIERRLLPLSEESQ
jgi:hypothetical protein